MERRLDCLLWVLRYVWRILSRKISDPTLLFDHSVLLCKEWILGRQKWKQGGQREVFQESGWVWIRIMAAKKTGVAWIAHPEKFLEKYQYLFLEFKGQLMPSYKFEVPGKMLCPHVILPYRFAYPFGLGALRGEVLYSLHPVQGHWLIWGTALLRGEERDMIFLTMDTEL